MGQFKAGLFLFGVCMGAANPRPRSIASIIFISVLLGPIFVMLWLGRGLLALAYLVVTIGIVLMAVVLESLGILSSAPLEFLPIHTAASLSVYALPALVGLVHGLKIRAVSTGRPWFRWIAIIPAWLGGIVLLLLVLHLPFRTFLFQPFDVPSASNEPSLMVGDYFLVSKFAYGYSRFSFPFNLASFAGRTGNSHPRRGDMAVYKLPTNTNIDYVKRVIGLPGDRIQMRSGVLHINGAAVKKERIADFVDPDGEGGGRPVPQYIETLPNGVQYRVLDTEPAGSGDNTMEYAVPPGHYFVLGDNRDNSQDSRYLEQVGYIPEDNFLGPVVLRFWSSKWFSLSGRP